MNSKPDNRLSLEWVKGRDGVALVFDKRTWKVFEEAARAREQSAEHMILSARRRNHRPHSDGQLHSQPLHGRMMSGALSNFLNKLSAA